MATARVTPSKTAGTKRVYHRKSSTPVLGTHAIASVPDKEILSRYVNRQITKKQTEFDVFDMSFELGYDILIEGPTGPGKTMATRAWCAHANVALARVPSNQGVENSHLFGKWIPDRTGKSVGTWSDGTVTHIVRYGGVILINEINFIPERVASILFGLLDDNREIILQDHESEVIRAHRPDCWCDLPKDECRKRWVMVVADMNPDYEGTRPLNKALRNRFQVQMYFDYDPVVEAQLISSPQLLELARQLRTDAAKGVYDTPVSTNMLIEFEQLVASGGFDFARLNFINHFATDEKPSLILVLDTHDIKLRDSYKPVPKQERSRYEAQANFEAMWDDRSKGFYFEEVK